MFSRMFDLMTWFLLVIFIEDSESEFMKILSCRAVPALPVLQVTLDADASSVLAGLHAQPAVGRIEFNPNFIHSCFLLNI